MMYIAVDLGTTLIKCTLYHEDGRTLGCESFPCDLAHPAPDRAEQDASVWYEGVCDAIRRLVKDADPAEIAGIGTSSQGLTVVPTDEDFHPLYPAISWLDTRPAEECRELLAHIPPEAWPKLTGRNLSPMATLPKLMWLKKHEPEVFSKAAWFLLPMDYLNARMTGNPVMDPSMASGTYFYDIGAFDWSEKLLELGSITRDKLAKILPAGTLVGHINAETAGRTGLTEETCVYNGGQDQKVAAYAAGIHDRKASLSLGTAGALEIFIRNAAGQSDLSVCPYVTGERLVVEGCINTAGAAIQWLKDTVCPDIGFDEVNRLAENVQRGSGGIRFYPHLASPGTPHRGLSCDGVLEGITLSTGRGEMIRSLYEGLAYEIRLNLETAYLAGSELRELVIFGGGSKSRVLCQIIADVTRLTVLVAENSELGSVGAAKLAVNGMGLDGDKFGVRASGGTEKYTPDAEAAAEYERLFARYTEYYR